MASTEVTSSPRAVLGVAEGADAETVRAAYKRRALETHPDKGGDIEKFRKVQLAYELLCRGGVAQPENPTRRGAGARAEFRASASSPSGSSQPTSQSARRSAALARANATPPPTQREKKSFSKEINQAFSSMPAGSGGAPDFDASRLKQVIPLPSDGLASMQGPPPPEVESHFKIIKMCILTMLGCIVGRILAGILVSQLLSLYGPLYLLMNVIIGVFLLNEDPQFQPAYNFMMSTCFSQCRDQCRGGLGCLMSFIGFNFISLIFDLVPFGGGGVLAIIANVKRLANGVSLKPTFAAGLFIETVCLVAALLAEGIGAFQGWRAYQIIRDQGTEMVPGSWAEEQREQNSRLTGNSGGPGTWGGGRLGGGGGGGFLGGGGDDGGSGQGQGRPGQQQNFQVFQGYGQRLGGE